MWFTFNINWWYDYTNAWYKKSKVIGLNVVCSEIINSLWKYLWLQQEWHCTSGNISADLLYLTLSSPILRSHISKILDCLIRNNVTLFHILLLPYNYLSFPTNVCGRGRSFFDWTIQLAYAWPITSSKISKYGNLVGNRPRIHRNPRQFTWCRFNLNNEIPRSQFSQLTHSRYFRHNLV